MNFHHLIRFIYYIKNDIVTHRNMSVNRKICIYRIYQRLCMQDIYTLPQIRNKSQ